MSRKKIAAVSYLNTRPFLYGLRNSKLWDHIDLSLEMPSRCSALLLERKVDAALVPAATLLADERLQVFSNYCIGSNGDVGSVKLYSQVVLADIKKILLDYQSKTSVLLAKVLAANHWNIDPEWVEGTEGFEEQIDGTTAGVVIGDRTFDMDSRFQYRYDLSSEWKRFSGMPFVFAVWAAYELPGSDFESAFNTALETGLKNIPAVLREVNEETGSDMVHYFENNLSYAFDDDKKSALQHFMILARDLIKIDVDSSI